MSIKCHKCGKQLFETEKMMIGRTDSCLHCMTDIRCCKNCFFYDLNSYNECREPMADRVTEKEKANFCDFFKIGSPPGDAEKRKQDQLEKAMALFKK